MNMNDERRNTIALLLSRFTEDEEAEREQARAEYESMTDEELSCALENFKRHLFPTDSHMKQLTFL